MKQIEKSAKMTVNEDASKRKSIKIAPTRPVSKQLKVGIKRLVYSEDTVKVKEGTSTKYVPFDFGKTLQHSTGKTHKKKKWRLNNFVLKDSDKSHAEGSTNSSTTTTTSMPKLECQLSPCKANGLESEVEISGYVETPMSKDPKAKSSGDLETQKNNNIPSIEKVKVNDLAESPKTKESTVELQKTKEKPLKVQLSVSENQKSKVKLAFLETSKDKDLPPKLIADAQKTNTPLKVKLPKDTEKGKRQPSALKLTGFSAKAKRKRPKIKSTDSKDVNKNKDVPPKVKLTEFSEAQKSKTNPSKVKLTATDTNKAKDIPPETELPSPLETEKKIIFPIVHSLSISETVKMKYIDVKLSAPSETNNSRDILDEKMKTKLVSASAQKGVKKAVRKRKVGVKQNPLITPNIVDTSKLKTYTRVKSQKQSKTALVSSSEVNKIKTVIEPKELKETNITKSRRPKKIIKLTKETCSRPEFQPKVSVTRLSVRDYTLVKSESDQELDLPTWPEQFEGCSYDDFVHPADPVELVPEVDVIDGVEFLSFMHEQDLEDISVGSASPHPMFFSDDISENADLAEEKDVEFRPEVDSLEESGSLVSPRKTQDASLIKGWKKKFFLGNATAFEAIKNLFSDDPLLLEAIKNNFRMSSTDPEEDNQVVSDDDYVPFDGTCGEDILFEDPQPLDRTLNVDKETLECHQELCKSEMQNQNPQSAFESNALDEFLKSKSKLNINLLIEQNPNVKPFEPDNPIFVVGTLRKADPEPRRKRSTFKRSEKEEPEKRLEKKIVWPDDEIESETEKETPPSLVLKQTGPVESIIKEKLPVDIVKKPEASNDSFIDVDEEIPPRPVVPKVRRLKSNFPTIKDISNLGLGKAKETIMFPSSSDLGPGFNNAEFSDDEEVSQKSLKLSLKHSPETSSWSVSKDNSPGDIKLQHYNPQIVRLKKLCRSERYDLQIISRTIWDEKFVATKRLSKFIKFLQRDTYYTYISDKIDAHRSVQCQLEDVDALSAVEAVSTVSAWNEKEKVDKKTSWLTKWNPPMPTDSVHKKIKRKALNNSAEVKSAKVSKLVNFRKSLKEPILNHVSNALTKKPDNSPNKNVSDLNNKRPTKLPARFMDSHLLGDYGINDLRARRDLLNPSRAPPDAPNTSKPNETSHLKSTYPVSRACSDYPSSTSPDVSKTLKPKERNLLKSTPPAASSPTSNSPITSEALVSEERENKCPEENTSALGYGNANLNGSKDQLSTDPPPSKVLSLTPLNEYLMKSTTSLNGSIIRSFIINNMGFFSMALSTSIRLPLAAVGYPLIVRRQGHAEIFLLYGKLKLDGLFVSAEEQEEFDEPTENTSPSNLKTTCKAKVCGSPTNIHVAIPGQKQCIPLLLFPIFTSKKFKTLLEDAQKAVTDETPIPLRLELRGSDKKMVDSLVPSYVKLTASNFARSKEAAMKVPAPPKTTSSAASSSFVSLNPGTTNRLIIEGNKVRTAPANKFVFQPEHASSPISDPKQNQPCYRPSAAISVSNQSAIKNRQPSPQERDPSMQYDLEFAKAMEATIVNENLLIGDQSNDPTSCITSQTKEELDAELRNAAEAAFKLIGPCVVRRVTLRNNQVIYVYVQCNNTSPKDQGKSSKEVGFLKHSKGSFMPLYAGSDVQSIINSHASVLVNKTVKEGSIEQRTNNSGATVKINDGVIIGKNPTIQGSAANVTLPAPFNFTGINSSITPSALSVGPAGSASSLPNTKNHSDSIHKVSVTGTIIPPPDGNLNLPRDAKGAESKKPRRSGDTLSEKAKKQYHRPVKTVLNRLIGVVSDTSNDSILENSPNPSVSSSSSLTTEPSQGFPQSAPAECPLLSGMLTDKDSNLAPIASVHSVPYASTGNISEHLAGGSQEPQFITTSGVSLDDLPAPGTLLSAGPTSQAFETISDDDSDVEVIPCTKPPIPIITVDSEDEPEESVRQSEKPEVAAPAQIGATSLWLADNGEPCIVTRIDDTGSIPDESEPSGVLSQNPKAQGEKFPTIIGISSITEEEFQME